MPDEFTPEASVDFETLAAMAAEAATNGDGPHYTPPPDPPPAAAPPIRPRADRQPSPSAGAFDPFAALEQIAGDHGLVFRELGDINAKLAVLQLQTIVMFGTALLLAVLVWKFARSNE